MTDDLLTAELGPEEAAAYWADPASHGAHAELIAGLLSLVDVDDDRLGVALVPIGAPAPRRRAIPRTVLVAAAAAVLAVAGLAVVSFVGGDDAFAIDAAEGVTVVAPDGSIEIGRAGTELDDGDLVIVEGFVDVGDGRLGPGRYEVRDGTLVPVDEPTTDVGADGESSRSEGGSVPAASDPETETTGTATTVQSAGTNTTDPGLAEPRPTTTSERAADAGDESVSATDGSRPAEQPATTFDVRPDDPAPTRPVATEPPPDGGSDREPVRPATSTARDPDRVDAVDRSATTTSAPTRETSSTSPAPSTTSTTSTTTTTTEPARRDGPRDG